jgi:hypothetical protein
VTAVTTAEEEFVGAFVVRFPVLRPLYEEHRKDMGELLPHVIFGIGGGFTDRIVDAYTREPADVLDWRSAIEFWRPISTGVIVGSTKCWLRTSSMRCRGRVSLGMRWSRSFPNGYAEGSTSSVLADEFVEYRCRSILPGLSC